MVIQFLFPLLALSAQTAPPVQEKPNIVFILADDMSFDSVSANNEKIGEMKTRIWID